MILSGGAGVGGEGGRVGNRLKSLGSSEAVMSAAALRRVLTEKEERREENPGTRSGGSTQVRCG